MVGRFGGWVAGRRRRWEGRGGVGAMLTGACLLAAWLMDGMGWASAKDSRRDGSDGIKCCGGVLVWWCVVRLFVAHERKLRNGLL